MIITIKIYNIHNNNIILDLIINVHDLSVNGSDRLSNKNTVGKH